MIKYPHTISQARRINQQQETNHLSGVKGLQGGFIQVPGNHMLKLALIQDRPWNSAVGPHNDPWNMKNYAETHMEPDDHGSLEDDFLLQPMQWFWGPCESSSAYQSLHHRAPQHQVVTIIQHCFHHLTATIGIMYQHHRHHQ